MTLTTARLMAAAVDEHDLLDRLVQERDAAADRAREDEYDEQADSPKDEDHD